jgi:hypothetical protein
MSRVKRRVFKILSVVSLMLFLATVGVWIGSYLRWDSVEADRYYRWGLSINRGEFNFSRTTLYPKAVLASSHTLVRIPSFTVTSTGQRGPVSNHWVFGHSSGPSSQYWLASPTLGFGHKVTPGIVGRSDSKFVQFFKGENWLFPAWLIVAITGLFPVYRIYTDAIERRAKKRISNHQCPVCGYDLRATPDRCPECGMVPVKTAETT